MINSIFAKELAADGHWPAEALQFLNDGQYSKALGLCQEKLKSEPEFLSGRVILARAYYHTGQYDDAEREFYAVLRIDPNHLIAMKYLGDLKFRRGDEHGAFACYERILSLDPSGPGPCSSTKDKNPAQTRILTIHKGGEKTETSPGLMRQIPFMTETLGDLLLKQGHPRLAAGVFERLTETNDNPRLKIKWAEAQQLIKGKESKDA